MPDGQGEDAPRAERVLPALPSIETVEYGRRVIAPVAELIRSWEAKAKAEGDSEQASKYRFAAYMIEHRFLGHDDGGCVIVAFDQRYLDPEWRAWYEGVGR